ncbi:MAG: gliding motility-associated C-terminal domain-containing protein [Chitinophagales bacterium]
MKKLNNPRFIFPIAVLCLSLIYSLSLQAQVLINEVMPKPSSAFDVCDQAMFNSTTPACGNEWVELYNPDECLFFDLSCYILASKTQAGSSGTFVFPEGSVISPMDFLVIGGAGATNVDIVLNDYANTDNFCGSDIWFLENTDGWIALFEPDGTVVNAIYWTFFNNEAFKLNSENEFNVAPCLPINSCLEAASLPKAKDIPGIVYIGQVSNTDLSIRRTVDGGDTWENNATPTAGTCNDPANCGVPTPFDVTLNTTNPTCDNADGTASAIITIGNTAPITYTWSADAGNNTDNIGGLGGGDYTLVVTNGVGCEYTEDFTLADAVSPPSPSNPINSNACSTDSPESISIDDPGAGFEVHWYDAQTAGTFLAAGASFTPSSFGSYYAEIVETESGSDCNSTRIEVIADQYAPIALNEGGSACSPDLNFFNLDISISGGTGNYSNVTANGLTINDNGGGSYTIEAIPANTSVTVNVEDDAGCTGSFSVGNVDCPCPTLGAPQNPQGAVFCSGESLEAIAVDSPADAENEIIWYDAETDGNQVATGNSFTPSAAGTYYAATTPTANDCESTRTAVTISELPAIAITQNSSACAADLLTYDLIVTISGGNGTYSTIDAGTATVTDNGDGTYTISGIPANTAANIGVEDEEGCTATASFNAPDCDCPDIAEPTGLVNQTICNGATFAVFNADAPSAGFTIHWFDASSGGTELATGNSFTPTSTGTYYAEIQEDASDCPSDRVSVEAIELSEITITTNNTFCSPDLTTYTIVVAIAGGNGNYSLSSNSGLINNNGDNTFTISNIPANTPIDITATDDLDCNASTSFNAPDCDCPDIVEPTGLANQTVCFGENFTSFNANDAGVGFTIHWFDAANGGTELATGNSFTPSSAGTYYVEVQEDASDCPSDRISVEAIELTEITISNNGTNCSSDLTTYTIVVAIAGGNGNYSLQSNSGSINDNSDNTFTISNIPANTSINITATDNLDCEANASFNAPDCDCPDIAAPTGLVNQTICNGADFAPFTANGASPGFTIHWFDAPNGGTELATGNSFTPTSAGIYYAEIQEDASDCPSERIPVEAFELSAIDIIYANANCSNDLTTYSVDVTVSGGNGGYTITANQGTVTDNEGGNYTISDIAANTNLSITATDDLDCEGNSSFAAPNCNCPNITEPTGLANQTICFGGDFAPFAVDDAGLGFTIYWFDAPNGGTELAAGNSFTPSTAGTYYAEIREDVSDCPSDRISVEAIELSQVAMLNIGTICSEDLATYSITVTVLGGNGNYSVSANAGNVDGGNNTFTVNDIPAGTAIDITATDDLGCNTTNSFNAPDCDCPDVAAPTGLTNQTICNGENFGAFTADDAGAGLTIYWYDAPNAGNELATGTSFTPSTAGTYYVEIREDESDCPSDRIAVEAIELDALQIVNNGSECSEDLQTYNITVNIQNGTAPYTFNANGLSFTDNGNGSFTIENVTSGTAATANVTDANDCAATLVLPTVNCDCPEVSPPTNPTDNSFCFGENPTDLTVDIPANGFEVQWFGSEFGGNVLATGASFTPSIAGTYWAEIVETASNCSSDRVSATLTELPEMTLEVVSDYNCSADLTTYGFQIFVSGGVGNYTVTAENYSVTQNNSTNFSIAGVPSGSIVNIEVRDDEGCILQTIAGPFSCDCPTVAAPTNPMPNEFCFGESPTAISVANPSGGSIINWYNTATGGISLATGASFTPSAAGSYFAETVDANACVSERVEVTLTELPEIVVSQVGFNCSADLTTYDLTVNVSGGSGGFGFSVGGLTVIEEGGGNFTIQGIAADSGLTLTVTDIEGCSKNANFNAPQCDCPDIAAPTNPQNAEVCEGETAAISVGNAPNGFSIEWYDAPFGGNLVSSSNSFTPSVAGTYYALVVEDASGCRSDRIAVTLSELPPISIFQGASACSEDLATYTATLSVFGGSGNGYTLGASTGTVVNEGFGEFSITNIAAGQAVTVNVTDSEGCEGSLTLAPKVCNCAPVNPPTNPKPATFCFGATPDKTISVATPPTGFSVNWYDAPFGGNLVSSSSGFVPSSAGTYYAEIVEDVTGCSSSRIPVKLTEGKPIIIEEAGKLCSADLATYDLNVQVSGGEGSLTLESLGFVVANNGLGNFTVRDIPAGTNVSVTATDVRGCEEMASFEAPNCDCPTVIAPLQPTGNSFCFGGNPTSISVASPFDGFSVRWYATQFGGTVLSTNPTFSPSAAGTYYAETVNDDSECTSNRVAVTLQELPQITLTQSTSSCSTDLTTYDLTVTVNGGSGGFELTANGLEVVKNSPNSFTIRSIPSGTAATATATDIEGCVAMAVFEAVNCDCDVVNPPTNPQPNSFCFGGNPKPIAVTAVPSGFAIRWYNAANGGSVIGTGASILPPSAGTFYAEMVETASGCVSSRIAVELIEGNPIVVTQGSSDCSADLTTYDLNVLVNGGAGNFSVSAAPYSVLNNGGDSFTITGIEANNSLSIVATDGNGCSETAIFEAPVCDCADDIASPTGASGNSYCADENPTVISVDAPPVGYNVRWYDAEFGGNLLSNQTSFIPSMGGTYYAELEQIGSGCTSTPRTPVVLTQFPAIVITQGSATCSADLTTFDLEVNVSGGTGAISFSAGGQTVEDLGNGNYVIRSIPAGSIVLSMASDEAGCNVQELLGPIDCDCDNVPLPTNPQDNSICFGETSADISVDFPATGFEIRWFTTPAGGFSIASGAVFTPSMAGTYYAEMVENGSGCKSESRVAVTLSENPEIVLIEESGNCSTDGTTYDLAFNLSGGTGVFNINVGGFEVIENGGGSYTIVGIPSGTSISIFATDEANCTINANFAAVNCDCPTVNPPTGIVNNEYCEDETPTPISVLAASSGFEIRWYDAEIGGNLLATGETFTPSMAGTYYAEMVDMTAECVSERVAVTLTAINCDCPTVNPPIGATNNQYCEDEIPTAISVLAAPTGFEIRWYDEATGGNLLATVESFIPSMAGTYYAEMVDLTTDCVSERVAVTLTAINCTTCTPPDAPIPVSPQTAVTCSGEPVEFELTALANTLIQWYDAPTNGNLLAVGPSYLTDVPGSYFAVAVNESDTTCISSPTAFNLSLQVPAESSFTATASDGCVGDAIEFSLASGIAENIAYIWTFIDTESGDTIAEHIGAEPFTMTFDSTGMYEVQLLAVSTDPSVCDGSTNLEVTISDMAVETIEDVLITLGEILEIPVDISATIGENLQFNWSASTGELPCEDCEFLTVSPLQNTRYTIVVTDEYGCAATADVTVRVESNEMALVPNAFSPNGDGVNDRFYVLGRNIETIDLQIYNRFGERIFQTSTVGDGWDGTYKNQDLDIGSYAYFVVVTYRSGDRELLKGNVTLIR